MPFKEAFIGVKTLRRITRGLGAGNRPERARMAAEGSLEEIRSMLNDGMRMVFITAGMGGETVTGTTPVNAFREVFSWKIGFGNFPEK